MITRIKERYTQIPATIAIRMGLNALTLRAKSLVARTRYTGIAVAVMKSDAFTMVVFAVAVAVAVTDVLSTTLAFTTVVAFAIEEKCETTSNMLRSEAHAWASK